MFSIMLIYVGAKTEPLGSGLGGCDLRQGEGLRGNTFVCGRQYSFETLVVYFMSLQQACVSVAGGQGMRPGFLSLWEMTTFAFTTVRASCVLSAQSYTLHFTALGVCLINQRQPRSSHIGLWV